MRSPAATRLAPRAIAMKSGRLLSLAATGLAAVLLSSGCASKTPSSGGPGRDAAWIVGDSDSCTPSKGTALTIKSVDGVSTVSGAVSFLEEGTEPCSFPTQVHVRPGYHTIGIVYRDGDEVMFGAFSVTAEAGRVYDISAHPVGNSYWFESKPRLE